MTVVSSAKLAIEGPEGREAGHLTVRLRPRAGKKPESQLLWDLREQDSRDETLAPVQLIEGEEYLYEIDTPRVGGRVLLDPTELFDPDVQDGRRGRLRPGTYTGTIAVTVRSATQDLGECRLEVRSCKLGYLDDYRWMLSALAHNAAEVLMQRFSPSELQRFVPEFAHDARTLYQRFAFLQSILRSGSLEAALSEILRRPHHEFVRESEFHAPGRGVRMAADIGRQLTGPGPRQPWPGRSASQRLRALPRRIRSHTTQPSHDTEANRFVRFAIDHWQGTVRRIGQALEKQEQRAPRGADNPPAPLERGLREVTAVLDFLDAHLAEELFREISPLRHFPMANQVLERREGYREIYRSFIASEAASRLRWDGGDDVYGAGQRNVATLYEYWVFLELARITSGCCDPGGKLDFGRMFSLSDDGVTLGLRRGSRCVLSGEASRLGRVLRLELSYNRTFAESRQSWTKSMKPDCSLRVVCDPGYRGQRVEVWLHFDAKYKVEKITELLGANENVTTDDDSTSNAATVTAKRDDLLKMHAYRDAIRRTAGAYVLYPGSCDNPRTEFRQWPDYHEILPGLGAFVLRPVESGEAAPAGAVALETFIRDVLHHVANQASRRERAAYWTDQSYDSSVAPGPIPAAFAAVPFLTRPPADTQVLLGYVKSGAHLEWITQNRRYNLRADDRTGSVGAQSQILGSELLLLYGRRMARPELWRIRGEPRLVSRDKMLHSGYPDPGGTAYFCLPLDEQLPLEMESSLSTATVRLVRDRVSPFAQRGAPVAVTWQQLLDASGGDGDER